MLTYRSFNHESDYNIMKHIVQQNCVQKGTEYPRYHIGYLDFERYLYDENSELVKKCTSFIMIEEREIGFLIAEKDEFTIVMLVGYESHIEETLNFVEHNCYDEKTPLITDTLSKNVYFTKALEKLGYIKQASYRFSGLCDLKHLRPAGQRDDGYHVRPLRNEDISQVLKLFSLAAGGLITTHSKYKAMMGTKGYSNALDLVVETPAGGIAAYCTLWYDPLSKIAAIEPIACTPDHRKKGLSKHLLLVGMNKLKIRGCTHMYVGTGGGNVASQALYKSVGFVECGKKHEWKKPL